MSAQGNMTGETKAQGEARAFMGNLIAVLGLLFIGYPLAPATIRTMLVAWTLIVVTLAQFIVGRLFQTTRSAVPARIGPGRSMDRPQHFARKERIGILTPWQEPNGH